MKHRHTGSAHFFTLSLIWLIASTLCGCGQVVFDAVTKRDTQTDEPDSSTDTNEDSDTATDSAGDTDTGPHWSDLLPEPKAACASYQPAMPTNYLADVVVGTGTPDSCSEAALRAGVAEANQRSFAKILFQCGPGYHTIALSEPLVVDSLKTLYIDGAERITLDGGGVTRIIEAGFEVTLVLAGLELTGGADEGSGGAVYFPDGGEQGKGHLIIRDSVLRSNSAGADGGSVYAKAVTLVEIFRSYFEDNSANRGGALHVLGDSLRMADLIFRNNHAGGDGGAVFMDGDESNVESEIFQACGLLYDSNTSEKHGSAIKTFMYGNNAAIVLFSEFRNNQTLSTAESYGALYHAQSPIRVENSTFTGNRSGSSAGAIYLDRAQNATLVNCTFFDNHASARDGYGGAIFVPTDSRVTIQNCTFSSNSAWIGPAMATPPPPSTSSIYNSILVDNYSTSTDTDAATDCVHTLEGGCNIQWLADGSQPSIACTADSLFENPFVASPADNGGNVYTMAITSSSSPAINLCTDWCQARDARGETRSIPCDAGAFEH